MNQQINHGQFANSSVKNTFLAIGMMLFLALGFKIAGDLTSDNNVNSISQTDSVVSTLNAPEVTAKAVVNDGE